MARDEAVLSRLRQMDPYDFEHFIADLWSERGWETTVRPASNDHGVDVEATKTDGLVPQRVVIQAKRRQQGNKVGRPKVQQYNSLEQLEFAPDSVVVVTTSAFTQGAREWASKNNVKLLNGSELAEIVINGGHGSLVDKYLSGSGDATKVGSAGRAPPERETETTAQNDFSRDEVTQAPVSLPEELEAKIQQETTGFSFLFCSIGAYLTILGHRIAVESGLSRWVAGRFKPGWGFALSGILLTVGGAAITLAFPNGPHFQTGGGLTAMAVLFLGVHTFSQVGDALDDVLSEG